jgi:hypothetical protein
MEPELFSFLRLMVIATLVAGLILYFFSFWFGNLLTQNPDDVLRKFWSAVGFYGRSTIPPIKWDFVYASSSINPFTNSVKILSVASALSAPDILRYVLEIDHRIAQARDAIDIKMLATSTTSTFEKTLGSQFDARQLLSLASSGSSQIIRLDFKNAASRAS